MKKLADASNNWLKNNSTITLLSRKTKPYEKEVQDIILFGSFLRGKNHAQDIDILVVFANDVEKTVEKNIRESLRIVDSRVSVISKSQDTIQDAGFLARDTIAIEGYSLLTNQFLMDKHGLTPVHMFLTDIGRLNRSDKQRFYYALNGRSEPGVLDNLCAVRLANDTFIVPVVRAAIFEDFLNYWNISFEQIPMCIPTRLARKDILS